MEVKEIKKEYTLVFDVEEIKSLKQICEFYIDEKGKKFSNDNLYLCKEIIEIKE